MILVTMENHLKKDVSKEKKLGIVNKFKGKSYEKQILYVNLKVRKKNYMQLHSFVIINISHHADLD